MVKSLENIEKKKEVIDQVKSVFLSKMGKVIANHTDNILISVFVSTTVVGYYSNYTMITSIVNALSVMLFGGLGASIGNFVNTHTKKECEECFYMVNFAQYWVFSVVSLCLFFLLDDFIRLWVGNEYVLGSLACGIICFDMFTDKVVRAVINFNYTSGMFRHTRYATLCGASLNIIFSLILGRIYGLPGVIGATVLARFLSTGWWHPYILIKINLKVSFMRYIFITVRYYIIEIILFLILLTLKHYIHAENWLDFIIETFSAFVGINFVLYIIFGRSSYYKSIKTRLKSLKKKGKSKKANG